jgi:diguanylate cyclase (GGDEF)-like protein/PAS domain S-box-containing protein
VTRRGSLLVVDDNEPNRDALSRRLRHQGYQVALAAGGAEAVALCTSNRFDLILLDVEMPGMSGLDVLRQLRTSWSPSALPVIMVTARSQGADVVNAFQLGANDYVTKPVDFPVALARISTHLSLKWAIQDLQESEERYALAVRGANDGVWDWNLVTDEVYWSPRWKAMLGYDESEIPSTSAAWLSRVHDDDLARVGNALETHLARDAGLFESEHRLRHKSGTYRWVRCRGAAVRNVQGKATRLAGSMTDITEDKVLDAVTGLPNRLQFMDLLERALKRARRRNDYVFALLMLGLDRFRSVTDGLGPLTADRLLASVARRLQASLRATDVLTPEGHELTLARLGGDEFMVLLDDMRSPADATIVADRLRDALQTAIAVDGHEVFLTAGIGIAVSTTGYQRPDDMLRDASTALHRAKAAGTQGRELFNATMRAGALSRLDVETSLRHAVASDAFVLHYQPIVSMETGRIEAFEALLRWQHPRRGLLGPADFLAIAEDTGILLDIERITLTEACRQMLAWRQQYGVKAPGAVCVNVSSRRVTEGDLPGQIEAILRQTQLQPEHLTIEMTESTLITDIAAAGRTLRALGGLGVGCSLDDFGTGYSSLSYLDQLRVDTLKLDRSFVSRLDPKQAAPETVRTIIGLAHALHMDIVAEGIESVAQLHTLRDLGCDYAQGFYFSPAVDASSAGNLIVNQPWALAKTSRTVVACTTTR